METFEQLLAQAISVGKPKPPKKAAVVREYLSPTTYIRINPEDVVMIQAAGNKSLIFVSHSNLATETSLSLKDAQRLFPALIRCHKSYLVNPDYIWKANTKEGWIMLKGNQFRAQLGVAGTIYRHAIMKFLNNE